MTEAPDWSAGKRADIALRADVALFAAVEEMQRALQLNQDTPAIVDTIKNAIHETVPPYGYTVLQNLCERERKNAFNQYAADEFQQIRQEFEHGIQDFIVSQEGRTSTREIKKVACNAWKEDATADRRIREMQKQPSDQFRSPYRGRPELYDPFVVGVFEATVARVANRDSVTWTRRIDDNKSEGAMLAVLVATIRWAMCIAWQTSAPPGREPPTVKAEGLLRILKSQKASTNSTD